MIALDTHVIIWDALKPELLSTKAKSEIASANQKDGIIFCEISLVEIAAMIGTGKVSIDVGYSEFVDLILKSNKYSLNGITPEIAHRASGLAAYASLDMVDRIIVATAIANGARLVTADERLIATGCVATVW